MISLGKKIKKLRIENKMTQDDLATIIFVTRSAISKWEIGKGYPSLNSLKLIAKVFHVSLDELLSGDDI